MHRSVAFTHRCWLILAPMVVGACGRGLIVRNIGQHDKILRTYDERGADGATIVISQWGAIVRKWRVTEDSAGLLYQVDTTARICRSGREIVACENIKRDSDMQEYIDW